MDKPGNRRRLERPPLREDEFWQVSTLEKLSNGRGRRTGNQWATVVSNIIFLSIIAREKAAFAFNPMEFLGGRAF
ncbi:hypothetical protein LWE61_07285 [Sphingobium sufflavum]|uniref:hypothetical protein n=1 Tax=Sphingobium sufflavum TaxID=1129547 RepID=UPI001F4295FA|nr:hypothetical protein [Sphingobium sufflavum]MCE7796363.1 hypothetical protein [Sphingobium sufflavum]